MDSRPGAVRSGGSWRFRITVRGVSRVATLLLALALLAFAWSGTRTMTGLSATSSWVLQLAEGASTALELRTVALQLASTQADDPSRPGIERKVDPLIAAIDQRFMNMEAFAQGTTVERDSLDARRAAAANRDLWREAVRPAVELLKDPQVAGALGARMIHAFDRFVTDFVASVGRETQAARSEIALDLVKQRRMLAAVGLCILALVLAVSLTTWKLASQVTELARVAERISAGDTDLAARSSSLVEIDVLASSFNGMTSRLIESRAYLENVIGSMADALLLLDSGGYLRTLNPAARRLLCPSGPEPVGLHASEILRELPAGQGPPPSFGASIAGQGENTLDLLGSSAPLFSHDGRLTGWVVVLTDVSLRNQMQRERERRLAAESAFEAERRSVERIRQLNDELTSSQAKIVSTSKLAALGEMAGGVAHEINNPLAVIYARAGQAAELLESEPLDKARVGKMVRQIESLADRIAKIIKGLRSFSRDGSKDAFSETSLASILEDTLALCGEKIKNAGASITTENFGASDTVECRPTELSQLLLNLIGNAFDAIQDQSEGKWIRIACANHGDEIEISVTDGGPGIPKEIRPEIMRPFFTTKAVGKGTGLGLSISMGIAKAHGGSLTLDEASERTRFVLRLPRRHGAGAEEAA